MKQPTQDEYYSGVRMVRYDLVKELAIAFVAVGVVVLGVTAILSSPDVLPVTIAAWSKTDPVDFVTTATGELAGTTTSAGYGQPYNSTADAAQAWGPISPQAWFGVRIPIDSANTFVIEPLQRQAPQNPGVASALGAWTAAGADQQAAWTDAYSKALEDAQASGGTVKLADGDYGPLPRNDVEPPGNGPIRRARWLAADQREVLPDRLHPGVAVHRGRGLPGRACRHMAPPRRPVGNDE
jgi:hypothetical protein